MFMTFRQMKADPGRLQDALGLIDRVVGRLNNDHGGSFGYSMQIGGDPTVIALSSPWATLGDYEKMRASIQEDAQIQMAIRMAADLFTETNDMIGKVINQPGERGAFAWIDSVRVHLPAVHDAMAFALEVTDYAEAQMGRKLGLISAFTGDRSQLAWVAYGSSLDDLEEANAGLEAEPDFQHFYKRSETLFVPGSAERTIWQLLG